jgi:hypothetical protein
MDATRFDGIRWTATEAVFQAAGSTTVRMPGHPGELSNLESVYAMEVAELAERTFAVGSEPALLRRYAEEAVVALVRGGTRVTAYVPELALRAVREAVGGGVAATEERIAA